MASTVKNPFAKALEAEGVTGKLADTAWSIYSQESGKGKNTKTSNAGAVGGMQVIPSTFAEVADKDWDINNPEHNARAGIRYIKKLDKMAGGDPALIGAGYYGGPGGLQKAKAGIAVADPRNPKAPTTLQYGQQIAARVNGSSSNGSAPQAESVQTAQAPLELGPTIQGGVLPEEAPVASKKTGATAPDAWVQFNEQLAQADMPAVAQVTPEALNFGSYIPMPNMESAMGPQAGYFGRATPRVPPQRVKPFKGWNGFNV